MENKCCEQNHDTGVINIQVKIIVLTLSTTLYLDIITYNTFYCNKLISAMTKSLYLPPSLQIEKRLKGLRKLYIGEQTGGF